MSAAFHTWSSTRGRRFSFLPATRLRWQTPCCACSTIDLLPCGFASPVSKPRNAMRGRKYAPTCSAFMRRLANRLPRIRVEPEPPRPDESYRFASPRLGSLRRGSGTWMRAPGWALSRSPGAGGDARRLRHERNLGGDGEPPQRLLRGCDGARRSP